MRRVMDPPFLPVALGAMQIVESIFKSLAKHGLSFIWSSGSDNNGLMPCVNDPPPAG